MPRKSHKIDEPDSDEQLMDNMASSSTSNLIQPKRRHSTADQIRKGYFLLVLIENKNTYC